MVNIFNYNNVSLRKKFFYPLLGLLSLFSLLFVVDVSAQERLESPSEFLGYELGSEWTPHHKILDYVRHAADHSPLVRVEKYGETNEGRTLMLAYISAEQNMNRLEEIRTDNLKRIGLSKGEAVGNETAIIWLSYNVHGNEPSSSEAAMKTIYELARPANTRTKSWLRDVVVIMDPVLNPDGRDRYVHWYKHTAGDEPNVHEEAREHHEPWPGGRTNHYYFDLNRDWAWLTQKESRQRVARYQQWMPHIHVDFHEQGYNEPYYFAPAAKPFHKAITDWQRDFQYTIGKNHAGYFNKKDWLYFTREVFDLFYPSYGDTYPIFNGAVGMTYEQGGHSRAGLGILRTRKDTLTLKDRLTRHVATGLSTVEVSARHAEELINEFSEYFERSSQDPAGKYKTFVIKGSNNPDKVRALFELLDRHNIEYGKATESRSLNGYNYATGEMEQVEIGENDYLVSASQPKSVLARVFFEPRPELEDSVTYDITAWEQHYAFGLEGYAVAQQLDVETASVPPEKFIDNSSSGSPYAYLARWQDPVDMKMLSELLRNHVSVRYARDRFRIENEEYDAGTLIITRSDNKNMGDRFDRIVREIASDYSQQLDPLNTGFVQSGADFGSSSVRGIPRPRVAVLGGSGISSNRVGELWHYFDRQINYPVTILGTGYFDSIGLHKYDVLILPPGSYTDLLDEKQFHEIKTWISAGGKLIALGGANRYLADKEGFGLRKKKGEADSTVTQAPDRFNTQQREQISDFNSGSVYKITLDPTHPMAFGYDASYFSLKLDTDAYEYLEEGWNVGIAEEDAHRSGFVGYRAAEKLKNTLVFGVQEMGSGTVVYMIDNPLFRAFWHNGKLLFGNAVFMVGN